MKKITPHIIRAMKGIEKFAALTAYDAQVAHFLELAEIPLILVGDSVGTTQLGHASTIPVTLEDMIHHTAAVVRGNHASLILADMPFMSYQLSPQQALQNAGRLLQTTGCDAVKLEGGAIRAETVARIVQNGIPVCAHIGLTPQSAKTLGMRVQGRSSADAERLLADAKALEAAGAFAIVLEAIPAPLAQHITREITIPTIGIGAGPHCDAQILVITDLLGLGGAFNPKFAKRYVDLGAAITSAVRAYKADVAASRFPGPEHTYS